MYKTLFKISKMDCLSEENLIQIKIHNHSDITNLDFDISKRKFTVYHSGESASIESFTIALNLGVKK